MSSKFLNRGAYGDVWSYPQDKRAVKLLEIKESDLSTLQSAAREIYVLVRNGTNLVPFLKAEFKYGSVELHLRLMSSDLQKEMKKRKLGTDEISKFTKDIATGIHWLHANNICHRDLKPSNILIQNNHATLCDFGLARPYCKETRPSNLTDYMVTRWYRAPEILHAKAKGYCEKIDMWSFGCIVYEMVVARPLFPISDAKELPKELARLKEKVNRIKDPALHKLATGLLHVTPKKRWDSCMALETITGEKATPISQAFYTGSRITDSSVKDWITQLIQKYPKCTRSIMHGLMLFEISGRLFKEDFNCAMAIAYLTFEKMPCRSGMFKEITKGITAKKIAEWLCTYYCGTHMVHEYEKTKDTSKILENICADESEPSKKKRRVTTPVDDDDDDEFYFLQDL